MIFLCCDSSKDACCSYDCQVEKNDKGLIIKISSDNTDLVKQLHGKYEDYSKCCPDKCC